MKKFLFVVAIASVSLVSCKKNRTCSCTVDNETVDTVFTNLTKDDANAKCEALSAFAMLAGGSCKLK